jgi:hypothetical protein
MRARRCHVKQLTNADMRARCERLEELAAGFAREVVLWRDVGGPLLFAERRAYLGAVQDAIKGAEAARVALAAALARIEGR